MLRRQGFTLIEILISMVLGIIVIASAYGVYISQSKGFVVLNQHTQATQSARMAIDQLSRELRMASFGVVGQLSFTDAKESTISFLGDIDSDVNGTLAATANVGASSISIDLSDEQDTVDATDYIFLHSGGDVQMIQVRQTGDAYSLDDEPDTIYLNSSLSQSYPASTTIVKTVETTTYACNFGNQTLSKNGDVTADNISNLEFHYYDEDDTEIVPATLQSLNVTERAAIRRIEIVLETQAGRKQNTARSYTASVDLRNMGTRGFSDDTCAPNVPTSISITDAGTCGHFTASWTPPATNSCDGSSVTDLGGFKIQFGAESGTYYIPAFNVPDETAAEYQVADVRLENGNQYFASIIAYDTSFNESSASSEVSFNLNDTQRPEAPTNLDATSSTGVVNLTWTVSEDVDASGYRIFRGTSADFTPSGSNMIADENTLTNQETEYADSEVNSCEKYFYKVSAVDCVDEGEYSEAAYGDGDGADSDSPTSGTTNTTPNEDPATPPSAVDPFGAAGGDQAATLSWTNPSEGDFNYVIIRYSTTGYPASTSGGSEVATISCTPGSNSTYNHTGLANGVTYYYSIFPCDRCGNCGDSTTASTGANALSPVVEIITPTNNQVISDGSLVFQARAYDPDESTLGEPPNVNQDNGKGITSISFHVTPDPMSGQLPSTEYATEFCGFSGNVNPCSSGDVSGWCSGQYNLWAVATDNENQETQTPYTTISVESGGVEIDTSYDSNITGTNKQQVNFQIKNTSLTSAKIKSITTTWDRTQARLGYVRIPSVTTKWNYEGDGSPAISGQAINFDYGSEPTLSTDSGTSTVQLEFVHNFTTLTSSASVGATQISVQSASGFSEGDMIYINGDSESTIDSISANSIAFSTGLLNSYGYGDSVSIVTDNSEMPMTGATLTMEFVYELTQSGQECQTEEMTVSVTTGPFIGTPYQDEPTLNTTMSTSLNAIQVLNYRAVPVHAAVTDYSGLDINSMVTYYMVTTTSQTTPPGSGYTTVNMSFSEGSGEYEGIIPFNSDKRLWVYFVATDGNSATDRKPATGAYTYDLNPDTTPPSCPLGLTATVLGLKDVQLQWQKSYEDDVEGYHIYRREECGSWAKKYTLVQDTNADTPDVVDYLDNDPKINTNKYCYDYYIVAVDHSANQSSGCEIYLAGAGDCPCGS